MELKFTGPSKTGKSAIVDAYIQIGKKRIHWIKNDIVYKVNDQYKIYFYHQFNGENKYVGRWYNLDFPKDKILRMKKNTLKIRFDEWDNEDSGNLVKATVTIIFSDAAVKKMRDSLDGVLIK